MGDAEVDVSALVAVREPGRGRGGGVGGVPLDERSRSRNVPSPSTLRSRAAALKSRLVEQRVERQLGRGERVGGCAADERALGEDLDVAGLVVDVAREPHQHLGVTAG